MTFKEKYGEWALVTGASAGIGKAFARALASEGINLILAARREEELAKLKNELEPKHGIEVGIVPVDLSADDFLAVIDKKTGGRDIDILVNNAGFGTSGFFHEIDQARETAMIKVNCIVPVALTRRYLPAMLKKKRGAVVFLSSIAANQPAPLGITYAATKVFDLFIGEALHNELKGTGVSCLSVQPGATATEFQETADYGFIKGSRTAEDVVRSAMKALGRKRTVVDGSGNKLLTWLARSLPRGVAISFARQFNEENRKHGS
jgi:short-subunit dehydrogenase